ncbi:DUF4870 domain-containing protein [Parapedobacter tibetensis]|uniref:DUF4870 domain-containing protein n=1 Tax=Parapedobacter tibetensis TaxID=2972951 RepID=UPI00214D837E|nr:DUF4870 domain-containing protein [Parapedobacter tibetensis]
MNHKTTAIIGYITIIGWIIAYLSYSKAEPKDTFVRYHLRQSLGIILLSVVLGIASAIAVSIIPALSTVFYIISFIPVVLMLLGIVTASNEAQRPVPVIGKLVENKFNL